MAQELAASTGEGRVSKRPELAEDIPGNEAREAGVERPDYMTSYRPLRTLILDVDRSVHCDGGYSGWVQLPNGQMYVVDYIVDDAPLAHIRGYLVSRHDYILFPDGDLPWMHSSGQPFRAMTEAWGRLQLRRNGERPAE